MRPYLFAFALLHALPSAALAQDADAGKRLFARCAACHDAEAAVNKMGPHLQGVFGRTAGGLDGYNYSHAMEKVGADGLVWDEETLGQFLADPKGVVPGTKMIFPGLRDPADIENMIAYLKSVSD